MCEVGHYFVCLRALLHLRGGFSVHVLPPFVSSGFLFPRLQYLRSFDVVVV